jgi:hypothetical protein
MRRQSLSPHVCHYPATPKVDGARWVRCRRVPSLCAPMRVGPTRLLYHIDDAGGWLRYVPLQARAYLGPTGLSPSRRTSAPAQNSSKVTERQRYRGYEPEPSESAILCSPVILLMEGIRLDRLFTDKASGKDTKRPQLEAMLEFVREGDAVVAHSMDRLARNLDDLRRALTALTTPSVVSRWSSSRDR